MKEEQAFQIDPFLFQEDVPVSGEDTVVIDDDGLLFKIEDMEPLDWTVDPPMKVFADSCDHAGSSIFDEY